MKFTSSVLAVVALASSVSANGKGGSKGSSKGASKNCGCDGSVYYQIVDFEDGRRLRESGMDDEQIERHLEPCRRRNLKGEQRELEPAACGYTFLEWQRNAPRGCILAPVDSVEQIEYYATLADLTVPTILGVMKNEADAIKCQDSEDNESKYCLEGWKNVACGTNVPDDIDIWAKNQPDGDSYLSAGPGVIANISPSGVLYDNNVDGDWQSALFQCCLDSYGFDELKPGPFPLHLI